MAVDRRSLIMGAAAAAALAALPTSARLNALAGIDEEFLSLPLEYREEAKALSRWVREELIRRTGPDFVLTVDNLKRVLKEIYTEAVLPPSFVVERDPDDPTRVVIMMPVDSLTAVGELDRR